MLRVVREKKLLHSSRKACLFKYYDVYRGQKTVDLRSFYLSRGSQNLSKRLLNVMFIFQKYSKLTKLKIFLVLSSNLVIKKSQEDHELSSTDFSIAYRGTCGSNIYL